MALVVSTFCALAALAAAQQRGDAQVRTKVLPGNGYIRYQVEPGDDQQPPGELVVLHEERRPVPAPEPAAAEEPPAPPPAQRRARARACADERGKLLSRLFEMQGLQIDPDFARWLERNRALGTSGITNLFLAGGEPLLQLAVKTDGIARLLAEDSGPLRGGSPRTVAGPAAGHPSSPGRSRADVPGQPRNIERSRWETRPSILAVRRAAEQLVQLVVEPCGLRAALLGGSAQRERLSAELRLHQRPQGALALTAAGPIPASSAFGPSTAGPIPSEASKASSASASSSSASARSTSAREPKARGARWPGSWKAGRVRRSACTTLSSGSSSTVVLCACGSRARAAMLPGARLQAVPFAHGGLEDGADGPFGQHRRGALRISRGEQLESQRERGPRVGKLLPHLVRRRAARRGSPPGPR